MTTMKLTFMGRGNKLLSNWTEEFMTQNQSQSIDDSRNFFSSNLHDMRNIFVPKQFSGMSSGKMRRSVPIKKVL